MKKFFIVLAMLIVTAMLVLPTGRVSFAAEENDEIQTKIFLPKSYLQYYKLDSPYAICRYSDEDGEEVIAISHKNRIAIYRDEKFYSIDLPLSDNQVKTIGHYGKYILYVYNLEIYAIDMTDFNKDGWVYDSERGNTGIKCNTFSVSGETLVRTTESNIFFNTILSSDNFSIDNKASSVLSAAKPSAVLLTESGTLYYNSADNSSVYVYAGDDISVVRTDATGDVIRCFAEGDNGVVYFSTERGIYSLSGTDIQAIMETDASGDSDLGRIKNPLGICVFGGEKMWVVDGDINAVQEIDLTDNTFTEFAITTNSEAINRLSGEVKDLCVYKDKIYALDYGRIVVIRNIDGVNEYNRIDVETDVKLFAAGDDKIAYITGGELKIYEITDYDEPLIDKGEPIFTAPLSDAADMTYSDGKFFILADRAENGIVYPQVFEANVRQSAITLVPVELKDVKSGKAEQITADVFGTVYYATSADGKYEFYGATEEATLINTVSADKKLLNLQTDFNGDLYGLYDGNEVRRLGGKEFSKTLNLHPNLTFSEVGNAVSMCLSYYSKKAYFVFGGLILCTSSDEDMDISTPQDIVKPEDFSTAFSLNEVFVNLKENSKAFEVDLSQSDERFAFTGEEMRSDGKTSFVKFSLGDNYSLIVSDAHSAIIRNADISSSFSAEKTEEQLYSTVGFKTYSVPAMRSEFITGEIGGKTPVKTLRRIRFNGEDFVAVTANGQTGYIVESFLTDKLHFAVDGSSASSAYLYKKDGVRLYNDENLTAEAEFLTEKTQVRIIGESENFLAVIYNGNARYVAKDAMFSSGKSDLRKALAIIGVALSMLVVGIFLLNKYFYTR